MLTPGLMREGENDSKVNGGLLQSSDYLEVEVVRGKAIVFLIKTRFHVWR